MAVDMSLEVIHAGETEAKRKLVVGDKVQYLSNLPFGNVKIRHPDGKTDVANPDCFKEFQ